MKLHQSLEPLFNQAWAYVRRCIQEQGSFLPFAMAVGADGVVKPFQLDQECKDLPTALSALIQNLIPLVESGEINTSVICVPLPREATRHNVEAVMFDLENSSKQRMLAVMQLRKSERYGWSFGPIEYVQDKPKLFAAQPGVQADRAEKARPGGLT